MLPAVAIAIAVYDFSTLRTAQVAGRTFVFPLSPNLKKNFKKFQISSSEPQISQSRMKAPATLRRLDNLDSIKAYGAHWNIHTPPSTPSTPTHFIAPWDEPMNLAPACNRKHFLAARSPSEVPICDELPRHGSVCLIPVTCSLIAVPIDSN